jgi:DNA-binding HxlR family transcriptional regulator
MPRRSYAHYCAIARSLDVLGERWKLLIIRELLPGPRRYTELHADLPGISTDVLAARLRELETDGLVQRRRAQPPTPAWLYELTPHGQGLLPVLSALAHWGGGLLGSRQPTDALRGHWLAIPLADLLQRALAGQQGVVELRLDGARCYVHLHPAGPVLAYDHPAEADAVLTLSAGTAASLAAAQTTISEAIAAGHIGIAGKSGLASALQGHPHRQAEQPALSAPATAAGSQSR